MNGVRSAPTISQHPDVVIIGGGLHGLSAAVHLSLRGCRCTIIERSTIGSQASSANAGGVRRTGRHTAELEAATASMKMWDDLTALVGSDGGLTRTGHIFLAETEADLKAIKHRRDRLRSLGYRFEEILDQDDVRHAVPGISSHVLGGIVSWDDGYADPFKTVRSFRGTAERQGVRILEKTEVRHIERCGTGWRVRTTQRNIPAPVVVNCAGSAGGRIAGWFGDNVPVSVEAPMMMVTAPQAAYRGPVLGRVQGRFSMKGTVNGSVLVGGGYRAAIDPVSDEVNIDFSGLAKSAQTLLRLMPSYADARLLRAWHGLEGYTADGLPVIGRSPTAPGVVHAFAFSGHGFQLGPVVGRIVAELVCDGETDFDITPFEIDRFATPPRRDTVWNSSGLHSIPVPESSFVEHRAS
jgi:sarcosine oxidase subunit beta